MRKYLLNKYNKWKWWCEYTFISIQHEARLLYEPTYSDFFYAYVST